MHVGREYLIYLCSSVAYLSFSMRISNFAKEQKPS